MNYFLKLSRTTTNNYAIKICMHL